MFIASASIFLFIVVADVDVEQTYASVVFWGFGGFLAGAKVLLPVSEYVDVAEE